MPAYTLPVASMRRRVVAVDMMRDNLAYIKTSLSQAGLDSYVWSWSIMQSGLTLNYKLDKIKNVPCAIVIGMRAW